MIAMFNDKNTPYNGFNENENTQTNRTAGYSSENGENITGQTDNYTNTENNQTAGFNGGANPTPGYAGGTPWQQPYNAPSQNGPIWNQNEYSYKPAEQYNVYSGQQNTAQENIYSQNNNKKQKKKKSGGISRSGAALLIAACIVISGAAGFGGAVIAGRSGVSSSDPSLVYKGIPSSQNLGDTNYAVSNVVSAVANSVTEIVTEKVTTNSFFGQYVQQGAGSGVIISADGYIVTCAHVIDGATTITVKLADGKTYNAQKIGSDAQTDIALIKIEPEDELTVATVGDSDKLIVGEPAIAIGNPLGELGGTTTSGIISALEREVTIDGTTYTLLQTNAAINPGNSGGALFNINGELIGIVNAKESGTAIEGLGFAIPINDAINVVQQLRENGYVKGRPQFGINLYEVTDENSLLALRNSEYSSLLNYVNRYGVYFLNYAETQSGDLQFGDCIMVVDDVDITSTADLKSVLAEHKIGDTLTMTVSRISDFKTGRRNMINVEITLVESTAAN